MTTKKAVLMNKLKVYCGKYENEAYDVIKELIAGFFEHLRKYDEQIINLKVSDKVLRKELINELRLINKCDKDVYLERELKSLTERYFK